MSVIITELHRNHDWNRVCSILEQLTSVDQDTFTEEQFWQQIDAIQANRSHKIFVAEYDDVIIGMLTCFIEPKIIHGLSSVGHIEDVVVDRDNRVAGVGRLLVQHAVEFASQAGCYKVILDCADKNVGFYEKCGFVIKGHQMTRTLLNLSN